MKAFVGYEGVRAGVIFWAYEKDKIVYVPISSIEKMMEDGKKSINIKWLDTKEYLMYEIPGIKKKVYFDSDYSFLMNLRENE